MNKTEKPFSLQDDKKTDKADKADNNQKANLKQLLKQPSSQ